MLCSTCWCVDNFHLVDTRGKKRLFLALWPNADIRHQLSKVLSTAGQDLTVTGTPVKPDNLHLTLFFLGDVPNHAITDLIIALDNIVFKPFDLVIDRWGHFHKPGILWLGISEIPDELTQLVKQIKKIAAPQFKGVSNNAFKPHISLLRNTRSLPQVNDFKAIDWRVDSFVLVESKLQTEGAIYTVLKQWNGLECWHMQD